MILLTQLWMFLLFVLVFGLTTTIPGFFLLSRLQFAVSKLSLLMISTAVGLSLWGLQGYIFGYAGIRFATYGYVFICVFLLFLLRRQVKVAVRKSLQFAQRLGVVSLLLLAVGVVAQSLQVIGSGVARPTGMAFFRVLSQDGVFHLSLIDAMTRSFPPLEPGLSGTLVQNYHYWSDLFIAEYVRIFGFATHDVFFRFFPILISLATGLTIIALCQRLTKNRFQELRFPLIFFALFFLYFGADSAYLLMLWLHEKFGFYTSVIDSGVTQFLNLPHATAKFLFLAGFLSLIEWMERKEWRYGIIVGLLVAVLFGVKIYFAFVFGIGLAVIGIFIGLQHLQLIIRQQKTNASLAFLLQFLLVGVGSVGLAAAIYLPPNRNSGGLGWYPLEWVKLFLADENLEWKTLRYKRAVAELLGLRFKIILYDLIGIGATLWSIHGTRLIGLVPSRFVWRFLGGPLTLFFFLPTLVCTFLGLFTLQESGSFNVFNFFASSLTLLALLAAINLAYLWHQRRWWTRFVIVGIVLITLPRSIYETVKIISSYKNMDDVVIVPVAEIETLAQVPAFFDSTAIIQSHPDNTYDMNTTYVAYFSKRVSYIAGYKVLETHAQDTSRLEDIRTVFALKEPSAFHQALVDRSIGVVYLRAGDTLPFDPGLANLTVVYENMGNRLYSVE